MGTTTPTAPEETTPATPTGTTPTGTAPAEAPATEIIGQPSGTRITSKSK